MRFSFLGPYLPLARSLSGFDRTRTTFHRCDNIQTRQCKPSARRYAKARVKKLIHLDFERLAFLNLSVDLPLFKVNRAPEWSRLVSEGARGCRAEILGV